MRSTCGSSIASARSSSPISSRARRTTITSPSALRAAPPPSTAPLRTHLDVIYAISRDELDEAIDGGARASAAVARMRDLIASTDEADWYPGMRARFLAAVDYEQSTL